MDNYETQTKNYAIGLSVDENDVDMQSQNSDLFSSEDMEEENESDDDIEYWLNDALEKINMTSDYQKMNVSVVFSLISTFALI